MALSAPRFIRSREDFRGVIVLGQTVESRLLDFKGDLDGGWNAPSGATNRDAARKKAGVEFCRDLAQFANTEGGCLVYGVTEARGADGRRVAHALHPLDDFDLRKKFMDEAVKEYLEPRTIPFETHDVDVDGSLVIAVNIEPSADLVSVWYNDGVIEYVYRTDYGRRHLNPVEAEAQAVNTARTGGLLLSRALRELGDVVVDVELVPAVWQFDVDAAPGRPYYRPFPSRAKLNPDDVNEHELTVHIASASNLDFKEVRVPLSMVKAAWVTSARKLGINLAYRVVFRGDAYYLDEV